MNELNFKILGIIINYSNQEYSLCNPTIAQLEEHGTVESCNPGVTGSNPVGRINF